MPGPQCGNNPHHKLTPGDQAVVDEFRARLKTRALIAEALYAHDHPGHLVPLSETGMEAAYRKTADAVMAALPAPVVPPAPTSRAAALREAAEVADNFTARYASPVAMEAAGIIGPHSAAEAIAEELRRLAAEEPK